MTTTINIEPIRRGSGVGDCKDCGVSDLVSLERTRFFPQQLVSADDLTQDQVYFREKLRRHNRLLHGWGIVCGAGVTTDGECTATVAEGYILGPYGDEILIDQATSIDVCKQDSVTNLDCSGGDPWCGDPPSVRDGSTVYLAVRHVERTTRPVRVPGCGCGCDGGDCEYSRIRDAFELKVLTELPATYTAQETELNSLAAAWECARAGEARAHCPPCPADPWVVLCDLTVSGGKITDTNCDSHRRYVASFANFSFKCLR
jgi:hypothetical protein